MKVLVVGGNGFLGSHLTECFLSRGIEATVFDLVDSEYFKKKYQILGSISDLEALSEAIKGNDYVFHLAGLSDLNDGKENPIKSVELNILGTLNVLEACREHNVKRIIFASSVYVHGMQGGFYRCSKQAAESYIREYCSKFGLPFTILRYGSIYGPRSDERNGL